MAERSPLGEDGVLSAKDVKAAFPALVGGVAVEPHTCLDLGGRHLRVIRDLGRIGTRAKPLRRLNISENELTRLTGLHEVTDITWLHAGNNKLASQALMDLCDHTHLTVLNLSHNKLTAIPSRAFANVRECLKALVLNDNKLSDVAALAGLTSLNTLILSHNRIDALPAGFAKLVALTKLSAAHNALKDLPDLSSLTELAELRLNDNAFERVPACVAGISSLRMLDMGNNRIRTWEELVPLASLKRLRNLNLRGNPVCETVSSEEYANKLRELCPGLTVLDGKRVERPPRAGDADEDGGDAPGSDPEASERVERKRVARDARGRPASRASSAPRAASAGARRRPEMITRDRRADRGASPHEHSDASEGAEPPRRSPRKHDRRTEGARGDGAQPRRVEPREETSRRPSFQRNAPARPGKRERDIRDRHDRDVEASTSADEGSRKKPRAAGVPPRRNVAAAAAGEAVAPDRRSKRGAGDLRGTSTSAADMEAASTHRPARSKAEQRGRAATARTDTAAGAATVEAPTKRRRDGIQADAKAAGERSEGATREKSRGPAPKTGAGKSGLATKEKGAIRRAESEAPSTSAGVSVSGGKALASLLLGGKKAPAAGATVESRAKTEGRGASTPQGAAVVTTQAASAPRRFVPSFASMWAAAEPAKVSGWGDE